jgi:hypothetical protein
MGRRVGIVVTDPFHDMDDVLAFLCIAGQMRRGLLDHALLIMTGNSEQRRAQYTDLLWRKLGLRERVSIMVCTGSGKSNRFVAVPEFESVFDPTLVYPELSWESWTAAFRNDGADVATTTNITMACIGPMTPCEMILDFLERSSGFVLNIVGIMGGGKISDNIATIDETAYNFAEDIVAARAFVDRIAKQSDFPVVFIGREVAYRMPLTEDDLRKINSVDGIDFAKIAKQQMLEFHLHQRPNGIPLVYSVYKIPVEHQIPTVDEGETDPHWYVYQKSRGISYPYDPLVVFVVFVIGKSDTIPFEMIRESMIALMKDGSSCDRAS